MVWRSIHAFASYVDVEFVLLLLYSLTCEPHMPLWSMCIKISIEHSTTCDSRTNRNYITNTHPSVIPTEASTSIFQVIFRLFYQIYYPCALLQDHMPETDIIIVMHLCKLVDTIWIFWIWHDVGKTYHDFLFLHVQRKWRNQVNY